jgi:hypothetical protein
MRVQFTEQKNGPERLVCEAEVIFGAECGPLAGMKLVGFALWKSPEGEVYITFPSRAFGVGGERRFFDYLRSAEGVAADGKRVKAWILEEYRQSLVTAPTDSDASSGLTFETIQGVIVKRGKTLPLGSTN